MSGGWKGSTRRKRLPSNWPQLRAACLKRDGYRCTHIRADTETRCVERATDADHVQRGDDHRLENLAAKCGWHHREKSSAEGNAAQAAGRRGLTLTRRVAMEKRAPKKHPGLL